MKSEKLIKKIKTNKGMSYVELIVVLSIFSVMTSVVLFNHGEFQAKIDIKNLASEVALKVVEAQKSSLSGKLSAKVPTISPWKPSYGIYLNIISDNKSFLYFTDLNNNSLFDDSDCTGECISKFSITKGNSISQLAIFGTGCPVTANNLTIVFKRPDSSALISSNPPLVCIISYVQITVVSPKIPNAKIKIYPSGRIEVN